MSELEFKEKARRQVFNSELRSFPIVLELYFRAFNIQADLDETMGRILSIVRTSENASMAYPLVCHYLDTLDENP